MSEKVIALDLPPAEPLPEATQRYFDLCLEKLGFVPNVLVSFSHNIDKLNAFTGMYNDLMLGPSGLSKLEREMIAVWCHRSIVVSTALSPMDLGSGSFLASRSWGRCW